MKRSIVILLLFLCAGLLFESAAQTVVNLDVSENRQRQTIDVALYDNFNGNYLLDLTLTFYVTQENMLFMIVGGERGINDNKTVWMFDRNINLRELQQRNRNLTFSREFSRAHSRVEPVIESSRNVEIYRRFQTGYEIVQSVPKPVFFNIHNTGVPIELRLRFYVSETSNRDIHSQVLTAKAGTTNITINIIK
ncbi:MAG: hypothetical protein LBI15_02320 [Dysgonamonadaceae bacterium]|nr:hypothetical protein [Dysgonamonadaceae bacterium]